MKKISVSRQYIAALIPALLVCAASKTSAQTASENYANVDDWLCQGNPAVTGPQALRNDACVPTSSANGLSYLEAYQLLISNPDPFTTSPDSYTDGVNPLITAMGTVAGSGTTTSGQMNGLQSYLSPAGANPAPKVWLAGQVSPFEVAAPAGSGLNGFYGGGINAGIAMHNNNPTAQYLADKLDDNDGVELGIAWGSVSDGRFRANGGHEVAVDSINMNGGTGTIGILDPWGAGVGANAGTGNAVQELLSVSTVTITGYGSFLEVTYPLTYVGPDDFGTTAFAGNGQVGVIMDDAIEGVPDGGTTVLLLGSAMTALGALRRRYC